MCRKFSVASDEFRYQLFFKISSTFWSIIPQSWHWLRQIREGFPRSWDKVWHPVRRALVYVCNSEWRDRWMPVSCATLMYDRGCQNGYISQQLLKLLSQPWDTRLFYRRLKEALSGFAPKTAMCWEVEGNFLIDEREVNERRKCYFEGHLIGVKSGEVKACGKTRQPPQQQHSSNTSDSNALSISGWDCQRYQAAKEQHVCWQWCAGGRHLKDGAGEAYRRNASAGCYSPSLQRGRQAGLLELSSHDSP